MIIHKHNSWNMQFLGMGSASESLNTEKNRHSPGAFVINDIIPFWCSKIPSTGNEAWDFHYCEVHCYLQLPFPEHKLRC